MRKYPTHLYWPVSLARHFETDSLPAFVQCNLLPLDNHDCARLLLSLVFLWIAGREQVFGWYGQEAAIERLFQITVLGADGMVHGD